eukprot:14567291-Heterocapsa_arctica.AAC.1
MHQDSSVLAAHNNLMRAMAFAMNHEVPRCKSTLTESIARTKGLIQYRQRKWSLGIEHWYRPLDIDSEYDKEAQFSSQEEGVPVPLQ